MEGVLYGSVGCLGCVGELSHPASICHCVGRRDCVVIAAVVSRVGFGSCLGELSLKRRAARDISHMAENREIVANMF